MIFTILPISKDWRSNRFFQQESEGISAGQDRCVRFEGISIWRNIHAL